MIERVFGVAHGALTFAALRGALRAGEPDAMEESELLDFKGEYPERAKLLDLARDVTSFANAGGGVLLFGVKESPHARERAGELCCVQLGEPVTSLQRSVHQMVAPSVPGLEWKEVPHPERAGEGLLALLVPRSPLAPHAVRVKDQLEFHVRKGRESRHMQEGELERAYRERGRSRAAWGRELEGALQHVAERDTTGAIVIVAGPVPRGRRIYGSPGQGVETLRQLQRSAVLNLGGSQVLGPDVRSRFRRVTAPRTAVDFAREREGDMVVLSDEGVAAISITLPSIDQLKRCNGWEDFVPDAVHPDLVGYATADMLNSRIAMAVIGLRELYAAFGVHGDVGGALAVRPGKAMALIDSGPYQDVHGVLEEEASFDFEFELGRLADPRWLGRMIGEFAVDLLGAFNLHWPPPVDDDGVFQWGRLLTTGIGEPVEFWRAKGILMAERPSRR